MIDQRLPVGSTKATAEEQRYDRDQLVTIEVTPTRIYAIRPPAGHHAAN